MEKEEDVVTYKKGAAAALIIFLKGMMMGCADIIPGVSGGTIALIVGIYQRWIEAINSVFAQVKVENIRYFVKFDFRKLMRNIWSIDFALIIPLALGIMTAFLALSNVIHYVMEHYTAITYAFFFGLIFASAVFLYKKLDTFRGKTIIMCFIGFIIGFIIVGFGTLKANHSLLVLLFSGSVAITAMILPGISGAFILVMLNQYEYVVNMIRTLSVKEIFVFGVGALFGLFIFTRILNYLLHRHKRKTMGFLIGLMLGSLRLQCLIIKDIQLELSGKIGVAIAVIVGFLVVYGLSKIASKHKGLVEKKAE